MALRHASLMNARAFNLRKPTMSDKQLTVQDLSPDQREVYERMIEWSTLAHLHSCQDFFSGILTIGGLGGSGKSTLLGVFAANTKLRVAYATFTGRAASVLQRKLQAAHVAASANALDDTKDKRVASCTTLHHLLYQPIVQPETEELLGWRAREKIDKSFELIVVDEASMVSDDILGDLRNRFGLPIIAVGDHGQLPPVMASGELMRNPDLKLEKIHRQALDNPIIKLAHIVREEGRFATELHGGVIRFLSKSQAMACIAGSYEGLSGARLSEVGILCWTNKNRIQLNGLARQARGFRGAPQRDEQVICLRNQPAGGSRPAIFNGMRGILNRPAVVDREKPWLLHTDVEFPDEGLSSMPMTMCAPQFNREKTYASITELHERGIDVKTMKDGGNLFDFGYAMTVHKSQGSSFRHAILYVDRGLRADDEEARRFFYTAATRASERLTILQ
jgi:exodeoxyribonuclease-5